MLLDEPHSHYGSRAAFLLTSPTQRQRDELLHALKRFLALLT